MGRRILLADDSITIQKVIELTLMDGEFDLVPVGSGDAALRSLAEGPPDLVIADIHMPGASGYEVCRAAKAGYPDLPVVLLVGTFEPFDPAEAEAASADAVLKKPFDSAELLETVRRFVGAAAAEAAAAATEPMPAGALQALPPVVEPAPPVVEPALEDDLELVSWEKLEIAAEPAAEGEPDAVWGNLEISGDESGAEDRAPIGFELAEPTASLLPDSGFSTLAFSRSELSIEAPSPAGWPAEPEPSWPEIEATPAPAVEPEPIPRPMPTPISPVWNAPELPSPPSWPEIVAEPAPPAEEPPAAAVSEDDVPVIELAPPEAALPPAPAAAAPVATAGAESAPVSVRFSDEDVDRIARRVVELLGDHVVREVAWEVVPDLAELAIKDRLRELEAQIEN